jgi:type I restriction enzyme M protein
MSNSKYLVDKLWAFCTVLRDDGVGTLDYTEQLTYLLFLKMAHERSTRALNPESIIPDSCSWQLLIDRNGIELEQKYGEILVTLSKQPGMLGTIFRKAQNKIQDPAKLRKLIVDLIDKENWSATGVDIKGDAYEGLLSKGAEDIKSGAGQYFTPRALIAAIVQVMNPQASDTICDPACGTGGFLLSAYEHVSGNKDLDKSQREHLRDGFIRGIELVDSTARLAAMNMLLHGMGTPNGESPILVKDALTADDGLRYSMVLANPPFGTKSSVLMIGEGGKVQKEELEITRDDFWVTTSNKQLNFMQHIKTILDINGRAAVVVPDNVLFEGGKGEVVRERLLREFDLHTLLRLPTGIFYKPGVKANVLFFDKKPASETPWTKSLWVYDLRTNKHFTLKSKPMKIVDLTDFIQSYCSDDKSKRSESERFRQFSYEELISRQNVDLDLQWLKDDSVEDASDLPNPEIIANEIIENLEAALTEFQTIIGELEFLSNSSEEVS